MKTLEELGEILSSTGYPVANTVFPKDEPHEPPYIIFLTTGSTVFHADGITYDEVPDVQVELYTLHKDQSAESKLQTALSDFAWAKEEGWLDDEQMYMVTYNFTL